MCLFVLMLHATVKTSRSFLSVLNQSTKQGIKCPARGHNIGSASEEPLKSNVSDRSSTDQLRSSSRIQ